MQPVVGEIHGGAVGNLNQMTFIRAVLSRSGAVCSLWREESWKRTVGSRYESHHAPFPVARATATKASGRPGGRGGAGCP